MWTLRPTSQNEAATKQSLPRKSEGRTPLRDLACQAAVSNPKLSKTRGSLPSTPLLTPLFTRISTQVAPASGTPVKIWTDPQPEQILGRRLPFTSALCKTDLQNMFTHPRSTEMLRRAHHPSDVLESSFEEAYLEGFHFGLIDVEGSDLDSDFTRSTPKGHRCVADQEEFVSSLNLHKPPVPGSEMPGKFMYCMQSHDLLGQRDVKEQCPEVAAGIIEAGQERMPSCSSLLEPDTYIVPSAGGTEATAISTPNQHPDAITPTVCSDSVPSSSLESMQQSSLPCEESAYRPVPPVSPKIHALDTEREVAAADSGGLGESTAVSHPCRGTVEGGLFPYTGRLEETSPNPVGLKEAMHSACQLGTMLEEPLHIPLGDNHVGVAVDQPVGTMEEEDVQPMSVEGERPLGIEEMDALPVGQLTGEVGALTWSVVERTLPLSRLGDSEGVALSGSGEVESAPALMDSKDDAVPLAGTKEVGPMPCSFDEGVGPLTFSLREGRALPLSLAQGTLILSGSRLGGEVLPLSVSGDPVSDGEGEHHGQFPRKGTVSEIHHSNPVASEEQAVEAELQMAQTVPAAGGATVPHLSGLDMKSLEQSVNEEGHSDLLQAKDDGRFLRPRELHALGAAVANTAERTGELTLVQCGLDSSAGLEEKSVANALSHSCHVPGEAEVPSLTWSSQAVGSSLMPGTYAVTGLSPGTSLEESAGTVATLACTRPGLPLPVSQEEAGTSRTLVSTSTAVTWVTPLALLERSMNCSATIDHLRQTIPSPPSQGAGTIMTPTCRSSATTWMTPIMLMERSMNTSMDFSHLTAKRDPCTQDNSVGTDSLLWNFSRERLSSVPRAELENRLENTLTVIEVLSRQLLDWQQNQSLASHLGPSAQRDACTQSDIIHASAEQQHYYSLYVRAMGRVQALQRSQLDEAQLKAELQKASSILRSQNIKYDSVLASVESFYLKSQKDQEVLSQQVCQMRALLADHATMLKRMEAKTQDSLQQRDEMRSQMEKALCAQKAADGCLADLEAHSSSVISQLRRDIASEKELVTALREAHEQQISYQKEVAECIESSHVLCRNLKADRDKMLVQCTESQELLGRHQRLMDQMRERLQTALQDRATMRCETDQAIQEKQKVCNELAEATAELHDLTTKNESLHLGNTRLRAELTSLMERLSSLESERDMLKEMRSEQSLQLSERGESLVCLQGSLDEKAAWVQELKKENWQMADVVLKQEQALSQMQCEKAALQVQVLALEEQQVYLQGDMTQCNKRLQEMAELKAQLSTFAESIEFIEQENAVAREENAVYRLQLTEMESQLKLNLSTLRERSLQCELKKDEIAQLRKERDNLQEELDTTKADASDMVLKMGEEISDSSLEVGQAKEKLLGLMETLKAELQGEDACVAGQQDVLTPGDRFIRTLGQSFFSTVRKVKQKTEDPADENAPLLGNGTSAFTKVQPTTPKPADPADENAPLLGNGTSAFTKVQPTTPKPAEVEQSLTGSLAELQGIITDLVSAASRLCCAKKEDLSQLKTELDCQKAECQSLNSRYTMDVSALKEMIRSLKSQNLYQREALNTQQQNMNQLHCLVEKQEKRVLELLSERKAVENLYSEISQLKCSVQLLETETTVLRKELSSSNEASTRDWIEEKILLQREVSKLRMLLIDTEISKNESLQKMRRHREILEFNLQCSEQEVRKLDGLLEKIHETLVSIPDVVAGCEELDSLIKYLG